MTARRKLTEAQKKAIEDSKKCAGGVEIEAGPCPVCGATWEDECRRKPGLAALNEAEA